MNHDYFSRAEVGTGLLPFAEVAELRRGQVSDIDSFQFLPDHLRDLEDPTVEQKIEIVRRLSLRVARVVHGGYSGYLNDLGWFGCPDEEYDFDLSLHVAAVSLAAIGLEVKATDRQGGITVSLAPEVEPLHDWLLGEYVPTWHYFLTANPEDDDEFEYDLSDKVDHADQIDPPLNYFFFEDHYEFVDLDSLRDQTFEGDLELAPRVAKRKAGLSQLQPKRSYNSALDGVVRCLVTVIEFFHKSGSDDPFLFEPIDDLRKQLADEIAENPDYAEEALERFEEDSKAELPSYEFWVIGAILDGIGLSDVVSQRDDGAIAIICPPDNFHDVLAKRDYFEGESDFFAEFDLSGVMSLGSFEHLYFMGEREES